MLWLTRKLQLKLLFPPLKPWFKCLRLPQLMLRILSKIKLLCRCNFCSFLLLGFSLRPFAFPSPLSSTWLLVGTIFSVVFVPSFLFYLLYAYVSLRPIWLFGSVLVPFCTPCLSCQCASPRKQRVSVVLSFWLPSPLHTLYLLFECASPRKHWGCVVLFFSAPLSLAHVLFVM